MKEYDIRVSDLHKAAALLCNLWVYCAGEDRDCVHTMDDLMNVLGVADGDKCDRCGYIYCLYAAVFAIADIFTPYKEDTE